MEPTVLGTSPRVYFVLMSTPFLFFIRLLSDLFYFVHYYYSGCDSLPDTTTARFFFSFFTVMKLLEQVLGHR